MNIHSNARNRRLYLGNMKGEVLSLPTFQTSVSFFFSQKVCFFTFQNLLRDFFEEKREMSLLGSRSSVRILTMMTFTLTDLANIS